MIKKATAIIFLLLCSNVLLAADYNIDIQGAHAFIQFRIKHLGYSWLYGRFDRFNGKFTYDETKPENSSVNVDIDIASINTNHAERDKHLKGEDFFEAKKFPKASFASTSFTSAADGKLTVQGNLTLKGITKPVTLMAERVGGGPDPWGGFRQGFEGTTKIALKDFGFADKLGPASQEAEIMLSVEGVRQ